MYNKPFIVLLVLGISSFAVPNRVRAQDAAEKGRSHATLGIIAEPTEKDASRPGVVVRAVTPNGPAAAAGMKMGDVIVKLGDQEVKDFDGLVNSLAKQKPGDKLAVHVLRDGNEKTFTVTLAERLQGPPPPSGGFFREKPAAYLGVQMQELTPEAKERLGVTVEKGVELTDVMPGTPAEAAGLKRGDVITHCDNRVISNPDELRRAVLEAGAGKNITLTAVRGKETKTLTAQLAELPGDSILRRVPTGPLDRFRDLRIPDLSSSPESQKVRQLEEKIEKLEKRIQELEQKLEKRPPGN